jgi:diadenosine tetraphosphate (Ap4A) HIT family hydrolase
LDGDSGAGMSAAFVLHPRLEVGGIFVADLALSRVMLKSDARWPWLILVPRAADVSEIHDLLALQRRQLMEEIAVCSRAVHAEAGIEKVNVAALGNQVAQLHVHVVGRWAGDPAWPDAVFGLAGKTAYSDQALAARLARIQAQLAADQA